MNDWQSEYRETEDKLSRIQERLKESPKGSVRTRMINGKDYYYLQYRDDGHVRSQYISADKARELKVLIEQRRELEKQAADLKSRLENYAKLIGVHRSYRPVRNVDYGSYTLFMSSVAHDYKSLDLDSFVEKYDLSKLRGINKRYLAGFFDYINGVDRKLYRRTNDLVLDPYTYLMYFKYGQKEVLNEELKRAIPAFLCRGLLITSVQEAVSGSYSK